MKFILGIVIGAVLIASMWGYRMYYVGDRKCSQFIAQRLAQSYYNQDPKHRGYLDTNHNGIACESLPGRK